MNKTEFLKGIHILQNSYNQSFNKEKLKTWWNDLKELNADEYTNAIEKLKVKNKYMPNIAEIKCEIMDNKKSFSDYNLNSCYWYINERMWCDENNVPYYDITNPSVPLPPYKE